MVIPMHILLRVMTLSLQRMPFKRLHQSMTDCGDFLQRRFSPREMWKGEKCILTAEDGSVEAVGRIQACSPDDIWMNEALGQLHVGVLVLSTSRRSCADQRMSHRRWPLQSTRLESGENLATIANFHSEQPPATDEEAYLGGVKKVPYTPVRRVLREGPERPPKRVRKT
jgi:hypothetical protein